MSSPLEYYANLPLSPENPGAKAEPDAVQAEALDDTVVVVMGDAQLTKAEVAEAVHLAVAGAVESAVSGAVRSAVAAAVKANVNPLEAETRFKQKYLGVYPAGVSEVDAAAPIVEVPRIILSESGVTTVALASPSETAIKAAEPGFEPLEQTDTPEQAVLASELAEQALPEPEQSAAEVAECVEASEETAAEEKIERDEQAEAAEEIEAVEVLSPESEMKFIEKIETVETVAHEVESVEQVEDPAPVEQPVATQSAPVEQPVGAAVPVPPTQEASDTGMRESQLRVEKSIQFVGFLVGTQMYAVPSVLIKEVIRRQPTNRLPVQTRYVTGVINLRGQVMPLVSLRELLLTDMPEDGVCNQFSIITGQGNMLIALEVDRIRSMYVIQQEEIVWNVSGVLGLDDDSVIGLFELDERLVPILSMERVAAILLDEGLDVANLSV